MATASVDPSGQFQPAPVARCFTAADLAAMPDQLPSGPVDFELHQGRLVPMSPAGRCHAMLQPRIAKALIAQGQEKGHGEVGTEAGVLISRNPDSVVGPDVVFVAKQSMPVRLTSEGYLETIPELIVEIRSKNDSLAELNRKAAVYLHAGVQLVWMIDPQSQTVTEHRPGVATLILTVADTLQCDDIIPGFALSLTDLFKD